MPSGARSFIDQVGPRTDGLSPVRSVRLLLLLPVFALLGGCDMVLMNPSGDVAVQQRNLILALDRPDAAHHPSRDGRDGDLRLALPCLQHERVLCAGLAPLDTARSADLDGAAADHRGARSPDLDQHPCARSLPGRRPDRSRTCCGGRREAAHDRSRGTRLEVAVLLPGSGYRHRERAGRAGGRADRVQDHVRDRDEHAVSCPPWPARSTPWPGWRRSSARSSTARACTTASRAITAAPASRT